MPDQPSSGLEPERAAAHLTEITGDVRAAVLLDGKGGVVGSSDEHDERRQQLAALTAELLEAIDAATPGAPPEQIEAHVTHGSIYALRDRDWTLAAVANRSALPSLMFYDMRAVLSELSR